MNVLAKNPFLPHFLAFCETNIIGSNSYLIKLLSKDTLVFCYRFENERERPLREY